MHALAPMRQPVGKQKEIAPREDVLPIPTQVQVGIRAPTDKEFFNPLLGRDFFERLLRIDN